VRFLIGLLVALSFAPSASGTVDLTAVGTRIGDHPAFVRVVVDFTDGDLKAFEPTLLDPSVWGDGRTRIEVAQRRIRTEAPGFRAEGVRVSFRQGKDRIVIRLASAGHRFKYVSYRVLPAPERLVIDLWKARPPVAAAEVRDDGCLRLTSYADGPELSMRGRELQPLFEHTVVVRLRDLEGRALAVRPLIASAGRWGTRFRHEVDRTQVATLEALAQSAKDGSLECLVQVRVLLRA
jgi:hypothetical protein